MGLNTKKSQNINNYLLKFRTLDFYQYKDGKGNIKTVRVENNIFTAKLFVYIF